LVDANGQNVRRLAPGFDPVWSPSGNLIAYLDYNDDLSEGYVRIVDVTTGQVTPVTTIKRGGVYPILAWASDTELLYYQDTVMLFDYPTGQKSKLLEGITLSFSASAPLKYLGTLPERGLIAAASGSGMVVLEKDKSGVHVLKQLEGIGEFKPVFSPDGSALAYVSSPIGQVKIVSTRGDDFVVALPLASRGTAWSMAWSPDGASLVYADSDGVHLVNRDGSGLQRLGGLPPDGAPRLAWSSRGSLMLSMNTSNAFFTFSSIPVSAK
jgi:Tol biopolymer transport system component